jgi:hypothetical protein
MTKKTMSAIPPNTRHNPLVNSKVLPGGLPAVEIDLDGSANGVEV